MTKNPIVTNYHKQALASDIALRELFEIAQKNVEDPEHPLVGVYWG